MGLGSEIRDRKKPIPDPESGSATLGEWKPADALRLTCPTTTFTYRSSSCFFYGCAFRRAAAMPERKRKRRKMTTRRKRQTWRSWSCGSSPDHAASAQRTLITRQFVVCFQLLCCVADPGSRIRIFSTLVPGSEFFPSWFPVLNFFQPGSQFRIFSIPDPGSDFFPSRIRIKEFKYLTPKNGF